MAKYEPWPENVIPGITDVLGDTSSGLTGSEIGMLLDRCRIEDPRSVAHEKNTESENVGR